MSRPTTFNFTVASELLRELGERLVGRHHVALAELIKNSYDADAENCVVRLFDNHIEVDDDGHGMTPDQFRDFWMRIGSTHKVASRQSPEKRRELTGSKGVGRLAAQFLANRITLKTSAKHDINKTLTVYVDWEKAQMAGELTAYKAEYTVEPIKSSYPGGRSFGMSIRLEGLKHSWTKEDIEDLGREVWALRSPLAYLAPGRAVGDFDVLLMDGEDQLGTAFDDVLTGALASWKARISGRLEEGRRHPQASVSVEFSEGYGADEGEIVSETVGLPVLQDIQRDHKEPVLDEVTFEILIFRAEGRQKGGILVSDLREYLAAYGGIHVYDGSFRLPHYGGERNEDWLSIGVDHARRISNSELLPQHLQIDRMMLDLPQTRRIFGVVSVSTRHEAETAEIHKSEPGHALTINIARDRLVDNVAYKQLRNFVRWALDFYVSRYRARTLRQSEKGRSREPPSKKLHRLRQVLEEHAPSMPAKSHIAIKREVDDYLRAASAEEQYRESAAALLAPLATAGMSAVAFTHELQREVDQIRNIDYRLDQIAEEKGIPELSTMATQLREWRDRMEALQELFGPLIGTEEDRSTPHPLRAVAIAEQTASAMAPLLPGIKFEFHEESRDEVRLPAGAMAEWSAFFQNVLANAWNAMIDTEGNRIQVEAGKRGKSVNWIRISDQGCGLGVPPSETEELFEPFARALEVSDDRRSLLIGGRGLGLTIARMIARRRGADVQFVKPQKGFATTLELSW